MVGNCTQFKRAFSQQTFYSYITHITTYNDKEIIHLTFAFRLYTKGFQKQKNTK